jgi:hypothetical protein
MATPIMVAAVMTTADSIAAITFIVGLVVVVVVTADVAAEESICSNCNKV